MSKVAIVTDSCASIPEELTREYDIQVVPLLINIDDKSYKDRIDIKTAAELFELVKKTPKYPTSAAPGPGVFADVYSELSRKTDNILAIVFSSLMSGTFASAGQAKEMVKGELPNISIQVIDSRTTVSPLGLMVIAAARAAASGQDMEAVIKVVEDIKAKINYFSIFDTLSYLARTGRISKAAAMAGNMLSMKPILEIPTSSGRPIVVTRPRTKKKALQVLLELVKERVKTDAPLHAMVEHVLAPEEGERLRQTVLEQFNCAEVLLCEFSPLSAMSCGPGLVGVSFYPE